MGPILGTRSQGSNPIILRQTHQFSPLRGKGDTKPGNVGERAGKDLEV